MLLADVRLRRVLRLLVLAGVVVSSVICIGSGVGLSKGEREGRVKEGIQRSAPL
jgi:hypothetical protein